MYAIVDRYFNIKTAEPELLQFVGAKIQKSLLKIVDKKSEKILKEEIISIDEKISYFVINLKNKDELYKPMLVSIKVLPDSITKKNSLYELVFTDIVDMKINNDCLKNLNIKYRTLLNIVNEIYFEYNPDLKTIRIYLINKNEDITLYDGVFFEWKKIAVSNKYIDKNNISIFNKLCEDIENCRTEFSYELNQSLPSKCTEFLFVAFKGKSVVFSDKTTRIIGSISSIANSEEIENIKLSRDSLTGLLNKNGIVTYTNKLMSTYKNSIINFIIIDIDNFKAINDNFGHLFGDEIIRLTADTIDSVIKNRGVVGRFGGDEFIIVFEGIHDNMELRSYLRAIRETIQNKFENIKEGISLTCSIGSSKYPTDADNYADLFEKADMSLYMAKQRGKNRYIIFDEAMEVLYNENVNLKEATFEKKEKNLGILKYIIRNILYTDKNSFYAMLHKIQIDNKLNRISIYYGENLEKVFVCGNEKNVYENGSYIFKENYLNMFDDNGVCVINNRVTLEIKNPDIYLNLVEQDIYSFVQCIIGSKDNIKGFISFEKTTLRAAWYNGEIFNYSIIASLIEKVFETHKYYITD